MKVIFGLMIGNIILMFIAVILVVLYLKEKGKVYIYACCS